MAHQLRVYTQRIRTDVLGRNILEARASQVVHLLGFRLDAVMVHDAAYGSQDDRFEWMFTLMAKPQAPVANPAWGGDPFDTIIKDRGTLGLLGDFHAVRGGGSSPSHALRGFITAGWVECDIMVPGLWMWASMAVNGAAPLGTAIFNLKFDWVTMTPIQIAALYTTYGIDSLDSTEREVVGQIDFSRAIGSEGVRPSLIG